MGRDLRLPSTTATIIKAPTFTDMEHYASCDWESHYLGYARDHHLGHCAYLLFSATDLAMDLPCIIKSDVTANAMRSWAEDLDRGKNDLDVEHLRSFQHSGVRMLNVKREPGHVLVVLASDRVACTAWRQAPGVGMRRFMCAPPGTSASRPPR